MLTLPPLLSKFKPAYFFLPLHKHTFTHTFSTSPPTLDPKTLLSSLLQGNIPPFHILQIHAQIFHHGLHQDNLIATRLIGHYKPQHALQVFQHLQTPNVFPFNAIIRVVSEEGLIVHALNIFKNLIFRTIRPNEFTFSFLLKVFFRSGVAQDVKQIHTHILKLGFDCNAVVCNGLLAVYAKGVKDLGSAEKLFDGMPERKSCFCWTCLISVYAKFQKANEALTLFLRMMEENVKPEDDTMVSVLSSCSNLDIQDIDKWEYQFAEFGEHHNDNVSKFHSDLIDTVLIYLNAKRGNIDRSREFFDAITERRQRGSVIHWNAMIGGYVQNNCPNEALSLFKLMFSGPYPRPNHVTLVSVLSACAQVGDLDLGKSVHEYLKSSDRKRAFISNANLATALIDMYAKCGCLEKAMEMFNHVACKDVVTFNVMIIGLAANGQGDKALSVFYRMKDYGIHPNAVTVLGVLSACNHSGMVDEGRDIFVNMASCYSVTPELEHYACYVDLLARVGKIQEALEVVSSMPVQPNSLVWGALLQGCLTHNRVDVARDIARQLVKVDPVNSAGYVMLSNMCASDHKWGETLELRGLMREKSVRKEAGCSWISINGVTHEFFAGSFSHPEIRNMLNILKGFSMEMFPLGPSAAY